MLLSSWTTFSSYSSSTYNYNKVHNLEELQQIIYTIIKPLLNIIHTHTLARARARVSFIDKTNSQMMKEVFYVAGKDLYNNYGNNYDCMNVIIVRAWSEMKRIISHRNRRIVHTWNWSVRTCKISFDTRTTYYNKLGDCLLLRICFIHRNRKMLDSFLDQESKDASHNRTAIQCYAFAATVLIWWIIQVVELGIAIVVRSFRWAYAFKWTVCP